MPRVRRRRTLAASQARVWDVVSDPSSTTAWWPGVERVEEATPTVWTQVLRSSKGKVVRADFTRVDADPGRSLAWRQEVEESPFERFLAEATTRIELEGGDDGGTRVELVAVRRLRGLARLGWPLVRRATRRQLDGALSGLERTLSRDDEAGGGR